MAQQLGVPIVPVSLVGSFRHFRTAMDLRQRPSPCISHMIETAGLKKDDLPALHERIRQEFRSGGSLAKGAVSSRSQHGKNSGEVRGLSLTPGRIRPALVSCQ